MRDPISEPNAGQPVIDSNGEMVQQFRTRLLRIVRFLNGGTSEKAYVAKTGTYVITVDDYLVDCSGTFTVTLPAVADLSAGREYVVKNSGVGTVTLDGDGAETIDGSATKAIAAGAWMKVMSDGANWIIIG